MNQRVLAVVALAFTLTGIACSGNAQQGAPPNGTPPNGTPPGGPPPEIFAACNGKTKGDSCSIKFGDREVTGVCDTPPPEFKESRLACRPNGMPAAPR